MFIKTATKNNLCLSIFLLFYLIAISKIVNSKNIAAYAHNTNIPSGFSSLLNSDGVKVFKKKDRSTYVTIINLRRGEMKNLTGGYTDAPNGKVGHRSMAQFWQDAIAGNRDRLTAKVVINGAFFAKYNEPTGIAFGLKSDGKVISYGYGLDEFPGLNKTIAWNNNQHFARITNYDRVTFTNSQFTDVVGALSARAGKRANRALGRTFIGVKDSNGDGLFETVLVFSSTAARQIDAANTLKSFGANRVAMLDGGGSTGLVVEGKNLIDSGTAVPHAIAFYSRR
jgi:hypothetical protein